MKLKSLSCILIVSSLVPVFASSGCATLEILDDKADKIFYKNEDWMNRGYSRHITNQEYDRLRKERIKAMYSLPQ